MKSVRENPESSENKFATEQHNREVFALQRQASQKRKVCACCEVVMITSMEFCEICDSVLDLAVEGHILFVDNDEEGPQE